MNVNVYETRMQEYGLDIPTNWDAGVREVFINVAKPIFEGTDYFLQINNRDGGKLIDINVNGRKNVLEVLSYLLRRSLYGYFLELMYITLLSRK